MAQRVNYQILPGIVIEGAYLKVVRVAPNFPDKTAEIFWAVYRNKEVADAGTEPPVNPDRRPTRVFVDHELYSQFFTTERLSEHENNPQRAAYALLAAYDEPLGLKALFETGEMV